MAELDLYDDILSGNLSPTQPVPVVESLLEVGDHRLVLRLRKTGCPLRSVHDALNRKLSSDAALRNTVAGGRVVVQRRSRKFGVWVDLVAGDKPLRDGERLRGRVEPTLEAGEVKSSDGEDEKVSGKHRHRSSKHKRSSRKHRHRHSKRRRDTDSSDEDSERRRRRKRHRHRRRDYTSESDVSSDERRRRRLRSKRRRRKRSSSSDSSSSLSLSRSRSRSRSRRSSLSSSNSSSRTSSRRASKKPKVVPAPVPPPPPSIGPVGAVAREIKTWQNMDPDFAEALRSYKDSQLKEAEKEDLVLISDEDLSLLEDLCPDESRTAQTLARRRSQRSSHSSSRDSSGHRSVVEAPASDSGEEVGSVLLKARRESTRSPEKVPEPRPPEPGEARMPAGQVQAVFLGLMQLRNKNPTTALHEYCASRRWKQPQFQVTEHPSDSPKYRLYKCSVKVDGKMYHLTTPATSKKDAKRDASRLCLEQQGVLPRTITAGDQTEPPLPPGPS